MDYPIKGFIETSFSDWPGKVVAVLFLPSCNWRCLYCHNHDLVFHPEKYPDFPLQDIIENLQNRQGWIDGICLTGGEPTIHPWLPSLIRELRSAPALNLSGRPPEIKLDTNGTHPEVLQRLVAEGLLDYVAMDLKGPMEPARYAAIVGRPLAAEGLERIHLSLQILLTGEVDYELRTTVVPTLLEEEDVYEIARRVQGARRYTLQTFNPKHALQESLRSVPPFDEITMNRMQKRVNEIIRKDVAGSVFRIARQEIKIITKREH